MKYFLRAFALVFLLLSGLFSSAQRSAIYKDRDVLYKEGLELFDKRQYTEAQRNFDTYLANPSSQLLKADASYYSAACGIELFNMDGEWLMRQFIGEHPSNPRVNEGYFYLGKSNFRKKKYKDVLEYFAKVDIYNLDAEQLAEYYFKRGYSYLQKGSANEAKNDFAEIKDVSNKYELPATYYFSHIAYTEKNYEQALTGFNKLTGDKSFGSVVPYYITQIYFTQGKYEKVVKIAPDLMKDSVNLQRVDEINRMIGESYYNLKDYASALPYMRKSNAGNAAGYYVLGYCYYKTGDHASALPNFERATAVKDSLAQNAWYHMADCYLRVSEKHKARNAFYNAYQLNFDKRVTEDALFSFARLSYELDFNPYNESVKAFTKYLKEYPASPRKDECYRYLMNVYSTTKNYAEAIKSIENMETIDPILKVTYQKLIYFNGIDHFNNENLQEAEKQFNKSLAQNSDPSVNALSQYWLSEIHYIRKDYSTAIQGWKKFQVMEGVVRMKEYDLSNYALGYAYFRRKEKEDYRNANIAFRKFLLTTNQYDIKKIADARIRAADCYFMEKNFAQAAGQYNQAIEMEVLDLDYCIYQKALCDGLNRNYEAKIAGLKKLESDFPKSSYLTPALNEIAETYYINLKDETKAIAYYEKIIDKYPGTVNANKSYAQLGNIYFGRKEDDKALEYYDKFVKADSKSDAAREVLESVRKIFESKGRVEEMEKYFASVGVPLTENQIEKAAYMAAYDAFYNKKDCAEALPKWESYLARFPDGKYAAEAWFNRAECAYSMNLTEKALEGYLYVSNRPRSINSEVALNKASFILFSDKRYEEALPIFMQLQEIAETPMMKLTAVLGAMRATYKLGNYETSLAESVKALNAEKLSPQQSSEARYIKARSLFELNRLDDAMTEFKGIVKSSKNVTGAEAYYHIAKIHFSRSQFKEVEKTVNKLISYEYSNDEWNNRGMLLLADSYIASEDYGDAEVIFQSVIESNSPQEFKDKAGEKLDQLRERKKEVEQKKQPDELKINYDQNKKDSLLYNKLSEDAGK